MSDVSRTVVPAGRLLERELMVIDEVLAGACGGVGGLVALEGEAGVGKSRLLAAAKGRACEGGMTVLAGCGEELERSAPWGLVGRMLAPALASVGSARDSLVGGAGTPAAGLFERSSLEVAAPAGEEVLAIAHALFWIVSDLAQSGPLLARHPLACCRLGLLGPVREPCRTPVSAARRNEGAARASVGTW